MCKQTRGQPATSASLSQSRNHSAMSTPPDHFLGSPDTANYLIFNTKSTLNVDEIGKHKFERQNSWQQMKHAGLYSDTHQALNRDCLISLHSQHKEPSFLQLQNPTVGVRSHVPFHSPLISKCDKCFMSLNKNHEHKAKC